MFVIPPESNINTTTPKALKHPMAAQSPSAGSQKLIMPLSDPTSEAATGSRAPTSWPQYLSLPMYLGSVRFSEKIGSLHSA